MLVTDHKDRGDHIGDLCTNQRLEKQTVLSCPNHNFDYSFDLVVPLSRQLPAMELAVCGRRSVSLIRFIHFAIKSEGRRIIRNLADAWVQKLTELSPDMGWDSGESVAEANMHGTVFALTPLSKNDDE